MNDAPAKPLRLFVAARLPDAAQSEAAALLAQLQSQDKPSLPGWRWVRPTGLHLTLRFLGETPPDRASAAAEALGRAAGAAAPFRLALDGVSVFGGRRPRVLWVGLAGDLDVLRETTARLNEELAREGWDAPAHPLRPHITLARARRSATAAQAAAARTLAEGIEVNGAAFEIAALELIESTLTPDGARYAVAALAQLGRAVE